MLGCVLVSAAEKGTLQEKAKAFKKQLADKKKRAPLEISEQPVWALFWNATDFYSEIHQFEEYYS